MTVALSAFDRSMGVQIYVQRNETRYGPYTREQIEVYLVDGSLSPSDHAWHAGLDNWRRLGELIPSRPAVPPGPAAPPFPLPGGGQVTEGRLDIGEALTFPLRDGKALGRLWWLPLAALVPFFGSILLRGWRLDLVRRVSRSSPEPLPDGRDLGRFLADGVVLLVMSLIYHLPLLVFIAVFGFGMVRSTVEVLWWAVQTFFTDGAASFWAIVADVGLGLLVDWIAPIVYLIAVWPLHRMAMMRFALTGALRPFFQVWRNLRLCLRFMPEVFLAFFVDSVALRLLRWIARALVTVGVGVIFAPLASALYFWATGHLFGQIAARVADFEARTAH